MVLKFLNDTQNSYTIASGLDYFQVEEGVPYGSGMSYY